MGEPKTGFGSVSSTASTFAINLSFPSNEITGVVGSRAETSTQEPEQSRQEAEPEASTQEPEQSRQEPETSTQEPEQSRQEPETSTQEPETSTGAGTAVGARPGFTTFELQMPISTFIHVKLPQSFVNH